MFTQRLGHILGRVLAVWLLVGPGAWAQTNTDLPVCAPWNGWPRFYPSPNVQHDGTIFAASAAPRSLGGDRKTQIAKSTDFRVTWQLLPPLTINDGAFPTLALSPNFAADQTLTVRHRSFIERSTDGGLSWQVTALPPVEGGGYLALADAQTFYYAIGGGVPPQMYGEQGLFLSRDAGITWTRIYAGLGVYEVALSPAFSQDHTLLISVGAYKYHGLLRKSTDGGVTWAPAFEGIEDDGPSDPYDVTFSSGYAQDQTIFCLNGWGFLNKTTNGGAQWQRLAPLPPSNAYLTYFMASNLVVSARYPQDQTLWVDAYDILAGATTPIRQARVSRDGGQTWRSLPDPIRLLTTVRYCRADGRCGVILFGARPEGDNNSAANIFLYKSYDYGQTWQCLEDPTLPQDPAPAEIPEPATGLLLVGGLTALAGVARRRMARPA